MKKDKWWGLLILAPVLLLLGEEYAGYFSKTMFSFPRHLLTTIFCMSTLIIYPLAIFKNKVAKIGCLIISCLLIVIFGIICIINPPIYSAHILSSGERYQFDDSYKAYLLDKKYGDLKIDCENETEDCMIHAEFKKSGKTILFVTHSITDVIKNCTRTIILDKGRKIFDGEVKPGIELYKKMIVGAHESAPKKKDGKKSTSSVHNVGEEWKKHFTENPDLITYGNGKAEVIDYGIFDLKDNYVNVIENNKEVVLKSKIYFNEDIQDPIFTMTLKDFKGMDIAGTNTLIERKATGKFKKGDTIVVRFKQMINVSPGKYTLSFSCTHFNPKGELEVLNRKYDALIVEVLSDKDIVGLVRLDSEISVEKL
jgi:hypothetical protein